MAVTNSQDPCLAVASLQAATITHQPQVSRSWVDMMDDGSPEMPPMFEDLLEGEPGGEEAEGNANSDLLDMGKMEEEEDDSAHRTVQTPQCIRCCSGQQSV